MKALLRIPLLGLVCLVFAGVGSAKDDATRLLDMYAKSEPDSYKIHIIANGDITQYKSSRKRLEGAYRLILDVPALPPVDSQYDLETPFSRKFQVWPMKLGDQLYSRVEIELDLEATSVIGMDGPSRIFVRISRESDPAMVDGPSKRPAPDTVPTAPASSPGPPEEVPRVPVTLVDATDLEAAEGSPHPELADPPPVADLQEPQAGETSTAAAQNQEEPLPEHAPIAAAMPEPEARDEQSSPAGADDSLDSTLAQEDDFLSLFPTPARSQSLFNVVVDDLPDEDYRTGIRLGQFLLRPSVHVSWIRGSNLLLRTDEDIEDQALMVRAGTAVDFISGSDNVLQVVYEARYRRFQEFILENKLSHFVDFTTMLELSPRAELRLKDHFVRGAFEANEFDPGQEVFFSVDPFYRNTLDATVQMDFSERLGFEVGGVNTRVDFLEEESAFFDYTSSSIGGNFLYHLSPLTTVFGGYWRSQTPAPLGRPEAQSTANSATFGMRGDISPLLFGTLRAGYRNQKFPFSNRSFSGLIADAEVTRTFSDVTLLTLSGGRGTYVSNFRDNGYYVSNRLGARFTTAVARKWRVSAWSSFFNNDYPMPSSEGVAREDRALTAAAGLSYFFTSHLFFRADYSHERRTSNLEQFEYRNNVIQFMLGLGFLTR